VRPAALALTGAAQLWLVVGIVVLLALAAVLAAAEAALTRVSRPRAEDLAEEGRRHGEALAELVRQPEQSITTVVFLRIACQLVQATLVGVLANELLGPVGVVVAIAVDVAVVFVLAEAAPKTWAVLDPERVALAVARPVRALEAIAPLRWAARGLIGLTNLVLPGKGLKQGPFVSSDEELLAVAEIGVEEGVIEEEERALIESIITFGDTIVREVMVPRPDMVTVSAHFRVADVMEVFLLNGYSRLPVCGDGLDDVVGLAYAKDLMGAERDGKQDVPVRELVRPARFVPETKRVPDMLREMQRDKFHMAVVVDEYGGTAGLVTLEDLIEELVGEIADEFDIDDPIVEPVPGGGIRVHARTPLDEVNDLLGARLPEGDWDTVGGLVYDRIGHVPVEGESVDVPGWRLTAQRIQGRRIGRVSIVPLDGFDTPATPSVHESAPERGRGDSGQVGGIEAMPFGLLVFVVGATLVANAWAVVDAKFAVDAAAREATRSYVEAEIDGAGGGGSDRTRAAEDIAVEAGLAALTAHGRDPVAAQVGLTALEPVGGQSGFTRCARATFTASYEVPALTLPWIGGFGHGIDVTSSHSELVDPYRSGVPGSAEACDG
jgi:magnesium and cobalt exporter, CNNM family